VLKHKSLIMVSVLVLVLAVVAMSCAPAKPVTPPAPPAPPVVAPPVVTPPVVTPPVVTPPVVTPPAAPAIVEKVTSYTSKKFANDKLSIAYPDDWTIGTSTVSGVVFFANKGDDNLLVLIRPSTDFKVSASDVLADLIKAKGMSLTPSIDNEVTVTLADGTKANVILLSAAFGMAKAAVTGVLKDGNAIMVVGASAPKSMAIYQEIGSTLIVK